MYQERLTRLLLILFVLPPLIPPMWGSETQPSLCQLKKSSGMFCGVILEMFYYDVTYGACRGFLYSGCGGNDNRFDTLAECEVVCVATQGEDISVRDSAQHVLL